MIGPWPKLRSNRRLGRRAQTVAGARAMRLTTVADWNTPGTRGKKVNQVQPREFEIGERAQVYGGGGGILTEDAGTKDGNSV